MKSNLKDKVSKGLKFIEQLKASPKIIPFLETQEMQKLGLYDFKLINRKVAKFSDIQQKIKDNKYSDYQQLLSELRLVFQMIGYYVPLNDPLQNDVKHFLNQIDKWKSICEGTFVQQAPPVKINLKSKPAEQTRQAFNRNQRHYESQRQKKIQNYATLEEQKDKIMQVTKAYRLPVRSTLAQKLEMIYFLKSHQTNEPFIHMIGQMYQIGKQLDDEYVIKLDNSTSCSWLQILQNNQQHE